MPNAARAAWSEQTTQAPPPRRRKCEPCEATHLPRDPNIDLALKRHLRSTLGILLAHTSFRNRHLVWASNERIREWTGLSKSSLDEHLFALQKAGRILWLKSREEVDAWFMTVSPTFGARFAQRPACIPHNCRRLIVLLAWLPSPTRPGAYGPLSLTPKPEDAASDHPENRVETTTTDRVETTRFSGCPIEKEESDEGETQLKSSSPTPGPTLARETTTDGPATPGEGEMQPWVAEGLRMHEAHPMRRLAENHLRLIRARAEGNQPNPSRPTSFVESPAAGHERDPEPQPEGPQGRQGDRGRSQVEAIVRAVAGGATTPQDGGMAIAEAVGDIQEATIDTYRAGMAALADGRVSLEEMLGVIADEFRPSIDHPNWRLSKFFAGARRRMKKPAAEPTRQSFPAAGSTQSSNMSPQTHCTVAK